MNTGLPRQHDGYADSHRRQPQCSEHRKLGLVHLSTTLLLPLPVYRLLPLFPEAPMYRPPPQNPNAVPRIESDFDTKPCSAALLPRGGRPDLQGDGERGDHRKGLEVQPLMRQQDGHHRRYDDTFHQSGPRRCPDQIHHHTAVCWVPSAKYLKCRRRAGLTGRALGWRKRRVVLRKSLLLFSSLCEQPRPAVVRVRKDRF